MEFVAISQFKDYLDHVFLILIESPVSRRFNKHPNLKQVTILPIPIDLSQSWAHYLLSRFKKIINTSSLQRVLATFHFLVLKQ